MRNIAKVLLIICVALAAFLAARGLGAPGAAASAAGLEDFAARPAAAADAESPADELARIDLQWKQHRDARAGDAPSRRPPRELDDQARPGPADPEWARLKRTTFPFAWRLAFTPQKLQADDLFRHEVLNASDTYIPRDLREHLRLLVEYYLVPIRGNSRLVARLEVTEFKNLLSSGQLQPLKLKSDPATLGRIERDKTRVREMLAALPPDVREREEQSDSFDTAFLWNRQSYESGDRLTVSRLVDGKFYGATLDQLPRARTACQYRDGLSVELAGIILNWFQTLRLLEPALATSLLQETAGMMESKREVK